MLNDRWSTAVLPEMDSGAVMERSVRKNVEGSDGA